MGLTTNLDAFSEFLLDHEMWLARVMSDPDTPVKNHTVVVTAWAHTNMIRQEFNKAMLIRDYVAPPKHP